MRRSDITIEETPKGRRMILVIRQSKTDQAGAGITRALVETKSNLCPVRFMESFLKFGNMKTEEPIFGKFLRLRLEGELKAAAIGNNVDPRIIGTHSLRAGGATALYIKGVSVLLIQRFGRWKSASFLRYLRYDVLALEPLSKVMAVDSGMLDQLRLARGANGNDNKFRAGSTYDHESAVMTEVQMEEEGWESDLQAEIDETQSPNQPRGLTLRARSPSIWSGGEDGENERTSSGAIGTVNEGTDTGKGRTWRARSPSAWSGDDDEENEGAEDDFPSGGEGGANTRTSDEEQEAESPAGTKTEGKNAMELTPGRGELQRKSRKFKRYVKQEESSNNEVKVKVEHCAEWQLSASDLSDDEEHCMAKQEVWERAPETTAQRDRNRRDLDLFARLHQRRVKQECLGSVPTEADGRKKSRVSFERGSSDSRRETVERAAIIKGEDFRPMKVNISRTNHA